MASRCERPIDLPPGFWQWSEDVDARWCWLGRVALGVLSRAGEVERPECRPVLRIAGGQHKLLFPAGREAGCGGGLTIWSPVTAESTPFHAAWDTCPETVDLVYARCDDCQMARWQREYMPPVPLALVPLPVEPVSMPPDWGGEAIAS